jgi:hypothetical protein
MIVRIVLVPISHGQDFVVWDKASAATLHGINVYQHHPHYPGGPYAYFPLFLYIELPFQWLAQHTALSFTVLGKVPIVAADLACALLIARELRRRGDANVGVAVGVAVFFLNPLVLYDGAYYGRFDTLGCALLLVALRGIGTDRIVSVRTAVAYGLAVAAKTFPVFVFVGLTRAARGARRRFVVVSVVTVLVLSAPYLGTLHPFIHDIVFYDAGKPPGAMSWQHLLLHVTNEHGAKLASYALLLAFALATIWFSRISDLAIYTALVLVLFIVCSKVVLEQYLIWPMPWLILIAAQRRDRLAAASVALLGAFTVLGMLDNESYHPFGRSAAVIELLLLACCAPYVILGVTETRTRRMPVSTG